MNSSLEWRRNKVMELASQGHNQSEISRILQISQPTVNRDIAHLRQQAKDNIRKYIDERLPEEYEKCLVGLTAILKDAWNISQNAQENKEKISALELAKSCYQTKLDLLTNATVLGDALKFVTSFTTAASEGESKDLLQKTFATNQENDVNDFSNIDIEEEVSSDAINQEENRSSSSSSKTINQVF